MAKNENKPAEGKTTVPALSEDNVMDRIKDENRLKDRNVQAALEKIKKDKDERQVREAVNMIMCAEYDTEKELLDVRARRRESKISLDILKKKDELKASALTGEITPAEYREKKRELNKEKEKLFNESSDQHIKETKELRCSYTGEYAYRSEWDY